LAPLHAIKIHGRAEEYFHSFLKSTLHVVFNFTLQPPYPQGKNSIYSLDSRVGEPEGRSGPVGEEVILLQYVKNEHHN